MSVTKSFTGTLPGILVAEGKIDPQAPITDYVPELKASVFGDARVHQAMDMTTGLEYTEVYTDRNSGVFGLRRANGMAPIEPGYEGATNILDFLCAQRKQAGHGRPSPQDRQFRRAGLDLPAGERHDAVRSALRAYLDYDGCGRGRALSRRPHRHRKRRRRPFDDAARSRSLRRDDRNHGRFNGRQIVPSAVVEDIARGGDPANSSRPATRHCPARLTGTSGG